MLFYQSSAPTGWTKVTSHNNKALRVVSGSGGGSGGSNAFTSMFASRSLSVSGSGTASISISGTTGNTGNPTTTQYLNVITDSHVMYSGEVAAHAHSYHAPLGTSGGQYGISDTLNAGSSGTPNVGSTGSNQSHHHAIYLHPLGNHQHGGASFSGSGSGSPSDHSHTFSDSISVSSSGTVDLRVQYVDVIICSKD